MRQSRRIVGQPLLEDPRVVTVRHEANLLTFRLLGDHLETHRVRSCSRLRLVEPADWQNHPRQNGAVDPPEEVSLVLVLVDAPTQLAI